MGGGALPQTHGTMPMCVHTFNQNIAANSHLLQLLKGFLR